MTGARWFACCKRTALGLIVVGSLALGACVFVQLFWISQSVALLNEIITRPTEFTAATTRAFLSLLGLPGTEVSESASFAAAC